MHIQSNRKAALLVTAMALGFGTAFAIDAISNAGSSLGVFVNSAQAAEGHDSGGHDSGKTHPGRVTATTVRRTRF